MEINVTRNNGIAFSEIKVGEVFCFDDILYMKVGPCYGNTDNAIVLSTGRFDDFGDSTIVTKVKAILNIEM